MLLFLSNFSFHCGQSPQWKEKLERNKRNFYLIHQLLFSYFRNLCEAQITKIRKKQLMNKMCKENEAW